MYTRTKLGLAFNDILYNKTLNIQNGTIQTKIRSSVGLYEYPF